MAPPSLILLLLLPLLAMAADSRAGAPPVPTPWPEQFHAVMFTNLTDSGRLQVIDLYYDWPGGRNLNLIRNQLSGDPKYDVEWTNGTSYIFDSASCRTIRFPVGILPPNWLHGAVYLGRETTDGFDCHVWTKVDFIWYYEDVVTHRPVRWNFYTGMYPPTDPSLMQHCDSTVDAVTVRQSVNSLARECDDDTFCSADSQNSAHALHMQGLQSKV
jgi:hypothetical protein